MVHSSHLFFSILLIRHIIYKEIKKDIIIDLPEILASSIGHWTSQILLILEKLCIFGKRIFFSKDCTQSELMLSTALGAQIGVEGRC